MAQARARARPLYRHTGPLCLQTAGRYEERTTNPLRRMTFTEDTPRRHHHRLNNNRLRLNQTGRGLTHEASAATHPVPFDSATACVNTKKPDNNTPHNYNTHPALPAHRQPFTHAEEARVHLDSFSPPHAAPSPPQTNALQGGVASRSRGERERRVGRHERAIVRRMADLWRRQ